MNEEFEEGFYEVEWEVIVFRVIFIGCVCVKCVVGSGFVFVDIVNEF